MSFSTAQTTLYWHDYETWGEVPAKDRPSQFAGVRTDLALNVIGEPLMLYCKPAPDFLPKPEACLITGVSPLTALEKGVDENVFVAAIAKELGRPGTCGVGYNSIRFDDEVTRYALYRNFYDPYEREWKAGNSRWDLIDVVRMTRALRPEGIVWPNYDDGTPCFKLEALAAANGIAHDNAHDALSDVYATIALARLIKAKQPKLFDYAFSLRNKRVVMAQIDIEQQKPLLHISSRFSSAQGNAAIVLPLAKHPQNANSIICINLAQDPSLLLELPAEVLKERLYVRQEDLPEGVERIALKEIHINKSPMVLPTASLTDDIAESLGIDRHLAERHWRVFHALSLAERIALQHKLEAIYQGTPFPTTDDPDQMLYSGGFLSDEDKNLGLQVRQMSAEALAEGVLPFKDSRLPEMLFRYRARNYPTTLNSEESARWQAYCAARLQDSALGASLTLADFWPRFYAAQATAKDDHARKVLFELECYVKKLSQSLGIIDYSCAKPLE